MHTLRALIVSLLLAIACTIATSSTPERITESSSSCYDIAEIYEEIEAPRGSKVKDGYGNMVSVDEIYVPTKLETGTYSVRVNRVGSNFYQVYGTKYYIETKYCYEYAYYEDVILKITSNYGYTKGEIIFD